MLAFHLLVAGNMLRSTAKLCCCGISPHYTVYNHPHATKIQTAFLRYLPFQSLSNRQLPFADAPEYPIMPIPTRSFSLREPRQQVSLPALPCLLPCLRLLIQLHSRFSIIKRRNPLH